MEDIIETMHLHAKGEWKKADRSLNTSDSSFWEGYASACAAVLTLIKSTKFEGDFIQ